MNVKINRTLRTEKPAADTGHCPILITVTGGGQRIRFSPGLTSHPDSWDKATQLLKPRAPYAKETNAKLREWEEVIDEEADRLPDGAALQDLSAAVLNRLQPAKVARREAPAPVLLVPNVAPVVPVPPPATAADLASLWAVWLDASRARVSRTTKALVSDTTISTRASTLDRLHEWATTRGHHWPLPLAAVCTTSFYEDFRAWALRDVARGVNTFAKYIKHLKQFLGWCEGQDDPARWPPSPRWRKFEATTRYIGVDFLDIEELRAIQALNFAGPEARAYVVAQLGADDPAPGAARLKGQRVSRVDERTIGQRLQSLEVARDIFLMCCYTGMRISDVQQLSVKDLRRDVIDKEVGKNRIRCVIPYFDDELIRPGELVRKYTDKLPAGRLLPHQHNVNEQLHQVGELAGITRLVLTSKLGRKTFVTLSVYQGVAVRVIMQATGHQTEANFNRYLGIDHQELVKAFRKRARPGAKA